MTTTDQCISKGLCQESRWQISNTNHPRRYLEENEMDKIAPYHIKRLHPYHVKMEK